MTCKTTGAPESIPTLAGIISGAACAGGIHAQFSRGKQLGPPLPPCNVGWRESVS
jgi:hypothetical protein